MNIWKLHRTQELEVFLPSSSALWAVRLLEQDLQCIHVSRLLVFLIHLIGQGLAPLAFLVPLWKTSYETALTASPASCFTWYLKLSGKHLHASHWIIGPWALPGTDPSALDSWGNHLFAPSLTDSSPEGWQNATTQSHVSHQFPYAHQKVLSYAWNSQEASVFSWSIWRRGAKKIRNTGSHWTKWEGRVVGDADKTPLSLSVFSLSSTLAITLIYSCRYLHPADAFDCICGTEQTAPALSKRGTVIS